MNNVFEFSDSEEGFDTHILNSIPGYSTLLEQTVVLTNHWLNDDNLPVIDIGGSTGKLLDVIQKRNEINVHNKFINVDPTKFDKQINNPLITFVTNDAQDYLKTVDVPVQIFISMFTLQFLKKEDRKTVFQQVADKISEDGAFFIAEKFYMETSEYQELYSVVLRDIKREHFSDQSILDKDKKLLKHLKLKTEKEFLAELDMFGFKATKYWQSLHFNAFICEKK